MRKILALLAFVAGLIAVPAVSLAAPPHAKAPPAYTSCGQSSSYGTRVCYDRSLAKVVIYTGATTVYYTFSVGQSASTGCVPVVVSAANFSAVGTHQVWAYGLNCPGPSDFALFDSGGPAQNTVIASVANLDIVEVFAGYAGYEFVWSN